MKTNSVLSLVAAVALGSALTLHADNHDWINPDGGDFGDPANWQDGALPASGDQVYFNASGGDPYTVTFSAPVSLGYDGRFRNTSGNNVTLSPGTHEISFGGFVITNDGRITVDGGTLTGPGSSLQQSYLTLGSSSGAGHLTLSNGASWTTGTDYSEQFRVGVATNGSTFTVHNSTLTLQGNKRFQIGYSSNGNTVEVTGASASFSAVSTSAQTMIGVSDLSKQGTSDNQLIISDGAKFTSSARFLLGSLADISGTTTGVASNNRLIITGAGSQFSNTGGTSRIGDDLGSTNNALIVEENGTFSTGSTFILYDENRIEARSGGSVSLNHTNINNNQIHGDLLIDGGSFQAQALTLASTGTISLGNEGTFSVAGSLTANGGSRLSFQLEEAIAFTIGGAFTTTGTTTIDITGIAAGLVPGDYTLLTYGSAGADLATHLTLGDLPTGLAATLQVGATSTVLQVTAIPEPSVLPLVGLSLGYALFAWRRRSARRPSVALDS